MLSVSKRRLTFSKEFTHLVEQPRREDDLEEVVEYQNPSEIEGFAILHQPRAQHFDEVNVREAYS